jgi:hypothetical protein
MIRPINPYLFTAVMALTARGALVAVFRVIHDHWSFNQAYSEMRSHHFKPWLASLKRMVARVGGNTEVQQELKSLANKNLASTNL